MVDKNGDKVALVTGAGRGIGEATAKVFARNGYVVAVNDIDATAAEETKSKIESDGGRAIAITADISDSDAVTEMVKEISRTLGPIDVLVNNAGIETNAPLVDLHEEDWDQVLDVNLKGTYLVTKAVAQEMVSKGVSGAIINLSSIHSEVPRTNEVHYDASKAGIEMLTKDVALELAEHKINVNCVAPGFVKTSMTADVHESEEKLTEEEEKIPWNRTAEPEEIAEVILFLASDEADYITGSRLVIDGGLSLVS